MHDDHLIDAPGEAWVPEPPEIETVPLYTCPECGSHEEPGQHVVEIDHEAGDGYLCRVCDYQAWDTLDFETLP